MTCAGQEQGTTTSRCSTGRAGTMATGRQTTPSGSATSAVQGRHRTNGEIHLRLRTKPDGMTGDVTTGGARTGIAMTVNVKTKGGNAFRLHRHGTNTRIRTPRTSCLSASATTSEAGTNQGSKCGGSPRPPVPQLVGGSNHLGPQRSPGTDAQPRRLCSSPGAHAYLPQVRVHILTRPYRRRAAASTYSTATHWGSWASPNPA